MSATSTDLSLTVLEALDFEWAEPCECLAHRGPDPAAWVLWPSCCEIVPGRPYLLACTACKDRKTESELGIYCEMCKTAYVPASLAWRLIEPLNRKS